MEEKVIVTKSKLTAIGDNIRNQTNTTKQYTLDEMASMKLGGTDTSDATATSEDILLGKTAYVNDVQVVGTIEDYDGSYDGEAEEGLIKPTGTYEVTDNGEYDITEYAKVNVNVVSSGGSEELPTDLSDMFYYNSKITSIDKFCIDWYKYTSEVTDMSRMFSNCTKLTSIPQLNTSKVIVMEDMFFNCTKLTSIPQLNTSKVTNMNSAFRNCVALTNISLSDTSKVTNIEHAFRDCKALKNISRLNTSNIVSLHCMFLNCYLIEKIDISYYNVMKEGASSSWCAYCYSLKAVIIRGVGNYTLNSDAFDKCYHLTGTVNATYNPTGAKDGYIYVPRNMVDKLKSATNWSTYADQIRALEDYTVDGTTTGDLDESKI